MSVQRTARVALVAAPATLALFAALPATAATPITVRALDPSPTVVTRPTFVNRTSIVRVSEKAPSPHTPLRFKVYPETYGYRPTSSSCQGTFRTPKQRTDGNGRVTIRLDNAKPWCKGVLYQAQALIGSGVADKFAHFCVRGTDPAIAACQDSYPAR